MDLTGQLSVYREDATLSAERTAAKETIGGFGMKFLLAAIHAKYIHTGLAVYSLRSCAGDDLREQ